MSAPTRPTGIVLIVLYSSLFGLASVALGCSVVMVGGEPGSTLLSVFGAVVAAIGLLLLVSAYGLWTRKSWGHTYTQALYMACIPLALLTMFGAFPGYYPSAGNTVLQLLGIAVDIAVLVYLSQPEVEAHYGVGQRSGVFDQFARREPH